MPKQFSRRDMLAMLTAGTGVAVGGAALLNNRSPSGGGLTRPVTNGPAVLASGSQRTSIPTPVASNDRMLVVLEMPGGNDGMSTVVPYGTGAYYDLRSSTAIAEGDVLRIDDEVGLHPSLVRMHGRDMTLVEGVGSFDPDGSHFEMMAQWWAGGDAGIESETGWIGRLADIFSDGDDGVSALAVGYGNHPIANSLNGSALAISGVESLGAVAGAGRDDDVYTFQQALRTMAVGGTSGGADGDLRSTLGGALDFADRLAERYPLGDEAADAQREAFGYGDSWLSESLSFTAGVLSSEIGVRVVHVAMGGTFDTHIDHNLEHPINMANFDASLGAFHDELEKLGIDDRVMVMTTSEFGRTPGDNGSGGLDHGTASTLMLSGPGTGKRIGEMPSFDDLDENGDFKASIPFESYLAGVVQDWLEVPASVVFGDVEPLSVL